MPDGDAALRIAGIALLAAAMTVAVWRLLGPFRLPARGPRGGIELTRPKEDAVGEPSEPPGRKEPAPSETPEHHASWLSVAWRRPVGLRG